MDLNCTKDIDKIIIASIESMKFTLAFYNLDWNNFIELLKTSFIGIIAQWYMGMKEINKNKILYLEDPNSNETQKQILNRFENEIGIKFLGEDWEAGFE